MEIKIRTHLLNVEQRTSKKTGQPYYLASYMFGAQPVNDMLAEHLFVLCQGKSMVECDLTVSITRGKFERFEVVGVEFAK